jgi:hypothetical protein
MGRPVEVRVLSRALGLVVQHRPRPVVNCLMLLVLLLAYLEAFLLAAHRAFISSESLLRPAGVSAPFFARFDTFCVPPAFLLAAQRAFISCESFLLPAVVS